MVPFYGRENQGPEKDLTCPRQTGSQRAESPPKTSPPEFALTKVSIYSSVFAKGSGTAPNLGLNLSQRFKDSLHV